LTKEEARIRRKLRGAVNRLASQMFTNGAGKNAGRLVLEGHDGSNLGGWGVLPFADRAYDLLKAELFPRKKRKEKN
jgi:hypothetical protein